MSGLMPGQADHLTAQITRLNENLERMMRFWGRLTPDGSAIAVREEQIERFGMTTAAAHKVRNRAEKACTDLSEARRAWQVLAYELRGGKGQPFQCPRHPEAVRFRMLQAIAAGETIDGAVEAARSFAWSEDGA